MAAGAQVRFGLTYQVWVPRGVRFVTHHAVPDGERAVLSGGGGAEQRMTVSGSAQRELGKRQFPLTADGVTLAAPPRMRREGGQ